MRRWVAGAIAIAASAVAFAIAAVPGEAKLVRSFCHPTGDYCVGVFKRAGAVKLDITTPSLTDSYGLCARRLVNGTRECHHFRFRRKPGGLRESRVDFQTRFGGPPSGRYCASWRYGGRKLHTLCFGYKRQI